MADHIATLENFRRLPSAIHLLCPRHGDNDQDQYGDSQDALSTRDLERERKITEAQERRKAFIASLQLIAYDGDESAQYQRLIWEWLNAALARCDLCIKEYYLAKIGLRATLQQEYEDEDIQNFFSIIDRRDVARIKQGLAAATDSLRQIPEQKRGISTLPPVHLHSIFEALICEAFVADELLLQHHLDEPFRLVQSRKPLRISDYLPAVTRFLFVSNARYREWAVLTWTRATRVPTDVEWSWAIQDSLQQQLRDATTPNAITKLWHGLSIIVGRLDEKQIINNLCDLVPNVCTTALNHLSKRTPAVPFILQTMKKILDQAPDAFWLALGAISASTAAEQVFAGPTFRETLQTSAAADDTNAQNTDALAWIPSLLSALKPANRPAACRTIATQLLDCIRNPGMTPPAKAACYEAMVKALKQTVVSFSGDETTRQSVKRIVLSDTLDTISLSIDHVLDPAGLHLSGPTADRIRGDVLDVVRNSLALECQCLRADFESLSKTSQGQSMHAESSSYTPAIWRSVIQNLRQGDLKLSSAALLGIMALPGLEQFHAKDAKDLSLQKRSYNSIFEKLTGMVSEILGRLSEFTAEHLDELYQGQDTSMSLVAALFSADQRTYQAAVDLIKNLSGQSARREALGHLLQAFLGVTVYSLCWTFRRISSMRTFSSVPRMLKSGMEILDVLCNTQTGILRTKQLADKDFNPIQTYWSYQWAALNTVFRQTERWSYEVHDKPLMTDVCRDAMQYAEALFEQYDVFASALTNIKPARIEDIRQTLLDSSNTPMISPGKILQPMSKWLRLRDEYLAETLVKLLSKMLHRLGQNDAHVDPEDLAYVQEVATSTKIKTILTPAHKALLIRALEAYRKEPVVIAVPKKQSSLHDWTGRGVPARSRSSAPASRSQSADEFGDSDIADSDLAEFSRKFVETSKPSGGAKDPEKSKLLGFKSAPPKTTASSALLKSIAHQEADSRAFIEQRKRETEARKLRDKEAAARLRGKIGVGEQTKGQGSGINGLGVTGKDHAAGRSDMMVSSDSESSSDSSGDEFDRQLFGSKVKSAQQHDRLIKKAVSGPVKVVKQQRSQKDIRARLAPDLSALHKTILGWDFFADTDLPPSSDRTDYSLVTNTFKTVADYQKTFEPLLLLEGWQSFRSAREESNSRPFEITISSQLIVDSFVEISTTIGFADSKDVGVGVADVVLLSKGQKPMDDAQEPHCLARVKEVKRKKGVVEIVYRVCAANNGLRPSLAQDAKVFGVQILSLTTLEREYGALMALPYYDLCDEIIRAKPSPLLEYAEKDLRDIRSTYDVNEAQAKAVKSALDNDAFTLIQGPPGSGKTKTICALVGAMMTGSLPSLSSINGRPNGTSLGSARPLPRAAKKVLICAPSNAAVDELVMRFKGGITTMNGTSENLSVVRLGKSDAINANVRDVTLDELVHARLKQAAPKDDREEVHTVMAEHKATCEKIHDLYNQFASIRQTGATVPPDDERVLDVLKRKKSQLSVKIDKLREQQNSVARDAELNRKRMQQEILDSAHVLCATLSGSGHDLFQGLNIEFDTVVIDEAAQSIELSALIPLKYGCAKCILVGDPKQLPPTVLSKEAATFQYEQSLFARMEKNHQQEVHLLDTQYRMHPEISLYPSKTFYDSRLQDGPGMASLRTRPWHHSNILAPYRFFDVEGRSQAARSGHSLVNPYEITLAMQLYERLVTDVSRYDFTGKIGIITPYKGQLRELKTKFSSRYGEAILAAIEFNTIDAFQGRESEIIIFSCVRASTRGVGFLNDIRRMNVGLTRAKCSLWVLGNSGALVQGEFWRSLIADAKARDLYTHGNIAQLLSRPLLTDDMMKDDVDMFDADGHAAFAPRTISIAEPAVSRRQSSGSSGGSLRSAPGSISSAPSQPGSAASRPSSTASGVAAPKPPAKRQADIPVAGPTGQLTTTEPRPSALSRPSVQAIAKAEPGRRASDASSRDGRASPSGGRVGLNDLATCSTCGSHAHSSRACNNIKAREASWRACLRCKQVGHSQASCPAPRCLQCGAVGHAKQDCLAPRQQHLSKEDVVMVQQQEVELRSFRDRARMTRTEQQMGEQVAKVPLIKATGPTVPVEGKRKREDDHPLNAPRGPKAMRPGDTTSNIGLGKTPAGRLPSKDSPKPVDTTKPSEVPIDLTKAGPDRPPPPSTATAASNGGTRRPMLSAPVIKRKKMREDDIFVKKK